MGEMRKIYINDRKIKRMSVMHIAAIIKAIAGNAYKYHMRRIYSWKSNPKYLPLDMLHGCKFIELFHKNEVYSKN